MALKKAEKQGASQVEAFTISTHGRSIYVENGRPRVADDKSETGLGVKLCFGQRIGFSSGTVSGEKSVEEVVNEALSIARTTQEDPNFKSLPSGRSPSGRISDAYSETTAHADVEKMVAMAMNAVKTAENRPGVKVPLGLIRLSDYSLLVVNSLGIEFSHRGTMVFSYFKSKAATGDKAGEGIEKEWATDISKLDFEEIGNSIARRALNTMKAESFRGESSLTALIVPTELEGLLYAVEFATNSEQINRKRSPWANQLRAHVASDKLTVWDDGRYPGGIRSAVADDEGVETSKKTIVDRGKLQSFIYDSYNASIAGVEATGNGFRRGTRSIEGAFASPATCAYSNMVVKPGNKSLDTIISKVDRGVLIESFASPEVNDVTGGFGCEIRDATLIKGGKLTRHVKHALLTGNIYEALRNIVDVSEEVKIVENTALPTLAFSNVTLVGQK
jgi:PmbA protein